MNKIKLEQLPIDIIQKILKFFQTKKEIKNQKEKFTDCEFNQLITRRRKLITISTDILSILNLSITSKYFNQIIKGPTGKLLLTVYSHSKEIIGDRPLHHISWCSEIDCKNICHYVNKDIRYKNIIKKIALDRFNVLKNDGQFKEDIIPKFRIYLTDKQIESYYKIKKMDKKLKEYEKTKTCKSSELDAFSLDSDYDYDS
jgi:hypothetical protein